MKNIKYIISFIVVIAFILNINIVIANSGNNFTIVVLPDTQYYSESYPTIFSNQTQWIVDNKDNLNIVLVIHLGDIVDDLGSSSQWENANNSMSILDGNVTYGIVAGNHDIGNEVPSFNWANYDTYFPESRLNNSSYWGGTNVSGTTRYYYYLFTESNTDFLVLFLAYGGNSPDTYEPLSWIDNVLTTYPNRKVILVTHSYLLSDGDYTTDGGQYIYDNIVSQYNNIKLVLCGHSIHDGEYHATKNESGHVFHELLSDYQERTNGGNGWLRIMKFVPDENKIYVKTYSPYLDQYETDSDSQFALDFEFNSSEQYTITLQQGYNMIGWTSQIPTNSSTLCNEVPYCDYVYKKNPDGSWITKHCGYPGGDFNISRGYGFLAYITQECNWTRE